MTTRRETADRSKAEIPTERRDGGRWTVAKINTLYLPMRKMNKEWLNRIILGVSLCIKWFSNES